MTIFKYGNYLIFPENYYKTVVSRNNYFNKQTKDPAQIWYWSDVS